MRSHARQLQAMPLHIPANLRGNRRGRIIAVEIVGQAEIVGHCILFMLRFFPARNIFRIVSEGKPEMLLQPLEFSPPVRTIEHALADMVERLDALPASHPDVIPLRGKIDALELHLIGK
jgi:hypothetical protein